MKRLIIIFFGLLIIAAAFFGFKYWQKNNIQSSKSNSTAENTADQAVEAAKPKEPVSTTVVAVGDIMLSRHVGTKIRQANDTTLPFKYTADVLKNGDITFANLESPFYDQGGPITEGMVFKAEPNTIEGLVFAGIDIVSLANNHFGNQGNKGMIYTFDWLKSHNISYSGGGNNISEAKKCTIIEKNGLNFCFLSYVDMTATGTPEIYTADEKYPGLNPYYDSSNIEQDISSAKNIADVVVVSFHWGVEYQKNQNQRQIDIAHRAIDSGASLIIGHHPHVTEPYEQYKNGYIFYSLGNFVFDQMWSEETRKGEIATISFKGKEIENIKVTPIMIYNYNQPRPN